MIKRTKILLLVLMVVSVSGVVLAQNKPVIEKSVSIKGVMSAVPADAWGAIVIKNLSVFSKTIDDYAAKLSVEPPNLQKRLVRKLGMGKLVDMSSPMAIIIMNKQLYGDQPVATVLLVKQYEQFAASLNGQVTETPGIMKGKSDSLGECYFAKKGSFVIIGPTEMIVNAVVSSKQSLADVIDSDAQKLSDSSQFFVHVNLPALVTVVKPFLMMFSAMGMMGGMNPMMQQGQGGNQAQPGGIDAQQMQQMQALGSMVNAVVGLLDELNNLDIGVSLKPDMIRVGGLLGFKPGQEMANLLKLQKPTNKPLIDGIPGGDFAMAGGLKWEGKVTKFQEAMIRANSILIKDPEKVQKYLALAKKSAETVKSTAFRVSLEKPSKDAPAVFVQIVQKTKDAKQYLDTLSQLYGIMGEMTVPGKKQQLSYKYKKNVEMVSGLPVDELVIDMSSIFNAIGKADPKAEEAKKAVSLILGSSVFKVKFVPVDAKMVVMQMGGNDEALKKFIVAAKSSADAIESSPKVVQIANLLPKKRIGEFYLDVGSFVSGVMNIVMKFESEGKKADTDETPKIPPITTALIGKTITVSGSSFKCDAIVPFSVIEQVVGLKGAFEAIASEEKGTELKKDKD